MGLLLHIRSKLEGVRYECEQYDSTFTGKDTLTTHIQSIHEVMMYSCNQCNSTFTEESNLTKHMKSKNKGVKYLCDQCEYIATHKIHLSTHKQSQHEGVRYECDKCHHKTTRRYHLKAHKQSKHEGVRYVGLDIFSSFWLYYPPFRCLVLWGLFLPMPLAGAWVNRWTFLLIFLFLFSHTSNLLFLPGRKKLKFCSYPAKKSSSFCFC